MALTLTAPLRWQTSQQRYSGSSVTADIVITGTGTEDGVTVQARWNSGDWTEIGDVSGGAFSGTLRVTSSGQGTLEVREGSGGVEDSVDDISVGDLFALAGQSQASGRGTNQLNPQQSSGGIWATWYNNSRLWEKLLWKIDGNGVLADPVSSDGAAWGNLFAHTATDFVEEYEYPMCITPCAKGSTSVTDWKDFGYDSGTLYGHMADRVVNDMGGKCLLVLWMQGQKDCTDGDPMDIETYKNHLIDIANDVNERMGAKLMPSLMVATPIRSEGLMEKIRVATKKAWEQSENIVQGPDLSFMTDDDGGGHLTSDAKLIQAGEMFFKYIKAYKDSITNGTRRTPIT